MNKEKCGEPCEPRGRENRCTMVTFRTEPLVSFNNLLTFFIILDRLEIILHVYSYKLEDSAMLIESHCPHSRLSLLLGYSSSRGRATHPRSISLHPSRRHFRTRGDPRPVEKRRRVLLVINRYNYYAYHRYLLRVHARE